MRKPVRAPCPRFEECLDGPPQGGWLTGISMTRPRARITPIAISSKPG